MRAIGVLVLLSGVALADPNLGPRTAPSNVIEVEPWTPPARVAQAYPGVTGKAAAAVVIDPGHAGDGRPWPYGIWIKPPGRWDGSVLSPGTLDLPASTPLSVRVARGLDDSIGAVLELLMTPRFVRQL